MENPKVDLFFENTEELSLDVSSLTTWIEKVCSLENHQLAELSIIICSDEYLLQLNREHLDHNYYTDIITFDLSEQPKVVEGELYISIDRVSDNASNLGIRTHEELHRVIIHGVLHLLGYRDKTEDEQKIMRSKEDASLSLLAKS